MLRTLFAIQLSLGVALASGVVDPPKEDECQAINATEPAECPEQIGPPCPPCIINNSPDYKSGDNATISNELQSIMSMLIDEYTIYWLTNYGPNITYPNNSNLDAAAWVVGDAGRSQLFLRLYYYTNNVTYLNIAKDYFQHGMSIVPDTQASADFFTSQVGLWAVGAIINDLDSKLTHWKGKIGKIGKIGHVGISPSNDEYIESIQSTLEDVNNGIMSNSKYTPKYGIDIESGTIFSGLSGALYAGLLINEYFDNTTLINPLILSNISYYLLDFGLSTAQNNNRDYLEYPTGFTVDCYMSGAAHGSSGVLNQIFNAYIKGYIPNLFKSEKYFNAIKNTLDSYVNLQLPDGNIPPYSENDTICVEEGSVLGFGNDTDSRVQWCHGAPGFLDTIPKAVMIWSTMIDGITTNETLLESAESYMTSALMALNATWQRGLLIKGLMMCHGIGGNAYTMLQVYDNLGNLINNVISNGNSNDWKGIGKYTLDDLTFYKEQSAWRASQFVQWTLNSYHTSKLRTQYSDEDYSVWLGSYGMPYMWIQAMQSNWPYSEPVCMPGWNLCIP